ncbi:hypothetical protein PRZ48_009324 [Zasmidium cellare]|uniref:Uncharacterized protein n=1 Tax=Zasmidium cellare TaxID=395010 RepID=A0ABR0EBE6_ZASCE|nr:hypothetical protein PRZ48_009324 [Zasmidium cellare]
MLLEWVDQSSLRGNDASGKRKVRSQAMKNFRSRQRAERQAVSTERLKILHHQPRQLLYQSQSPEVQRNGIKMRSDLRFRLIKLSVSVHLPEGIYKAKVLHELRERMQFPETAQSDETIAALMFLTSFDLSRANVEARTHLSALNGILKQKHGDNIPLSNSMMLETLDLISAIMFHTQPLTTPTTLLHTPSAWEMSELLAGLLSADSIAAHPTNLRGLNTLLSSAFAAVQATIINATMGGVVYETFYSTLEDFRLANCRDLEEGGTGIARVIYHQHAILYNLVANAHPYAHPSNTRHVTGLCLAIEAEPWRGMPFLRLMVLLTGLAASREAAKKAFFKARLVGAIYEMGVARWVEVREFVGMFLVGREFLEGRAGEAQDSLSPEDFGAAAGQVDAGVEASSAQVAVGEEVLDPELCDQLAPSPSPPKTNVDRQRRVQELLDMDRGFHDVIRRGDCWLTEHA